MAARSRRPSTRVPQRERAELGGGEAAELDTELPHRLGSTGEGPAEVLSIFGRPGERMHVRGRSRREEPAG